MNLKRKVLLNEYWKDSPLKKLCLTALEKEHAKRTYCSRRNDSRNRLYLSPATEIFCYVTYNVHLIVSHTRSHCYGLLRKTFREIAFVRYFYIVMFYMYFKLTF